MERPRKKQCKGEWLPMTEPEERHKPIWKWICLGCGRFKTTKAGVENIPVGCDTFSGSSMDVGLATKPGKAVGKVRGKYKKKIAGVAYEEGELI